MPTLINSFSLSPTIGIGTDTPNKELTVFGSISASAIVYGTSFYGDGSNLTGIITGGVGSLYMPLSGGTMIGSLSAPSLSSNNFYGLGSEVILSDGVTENNTGNGSNTLSLNFSNGVYIGGNGTLSATNITANTINVIGVPQYYYLTSVGSQLGTSPGGNFFGTQTDTLLPNSRYEIEYNLYMSKASTGAMNYTLSANNLFNSVSVGYISNPSASAIANAAVASSVTTINLPQTNNLVAGQNSYHLIKAHIVTGSNITSFILNAFNNAGTFIPQPNSFRKITKIV